MSDVEFRSLSSGRFRDFLRGLPHPIVALWPAQLFHVQIHGEGFALPLDGRPEPIRGFYTHAIVAARTPQEAGLRALVAITKRWSRVGHLERAGMPSLEVVKLQAIPGRWRWRRGAGYTFYL